MSHADHRPSVREMRAPLWERVGRWVVRRHVFLLTCVYALLVCREPVGRPATVSWGMLGATAVVLAALIEKMTLIVAVRTPDKWARIELAFIVLVALAFVLALTGPHPVTDPSALYPAAYLMVAGLAAWSGSWRATAFVVGAFVAMDAGRAAWQGVELSGWMTIALHAAYTGAAGFGASAFVLAETRRRRRAEHALGIYERRVGDFESRALRGGDQLEAMSTPGRRGRLIAQVTELDDALYALLADAADLVGAHSMVLFMRAPHDAREFPMREAVSQSDAIAYDAVVRQGEGLLGFVAAQGETVTLDDIRRASGGRIEYYAHDPGIRSLVAVPVQMHQAGRSTVEGVLVADSVHVGAFDDGAAKALLVTARQVHEALDHALIQQKQVEEAREFEGLYAFSQELSATLNLEQVLDKTLDAIGRIIPYDGAMISLAATPSARRTGERRDDGTSIIRAVRGPLFPADSFLDAEFNHREGFTGWVTTQGQYLYHPDVSARHMKREFVARSVPVRGVGAFLAFPLGRGDDVLGAITIVNETKNAWSSDEIRTLNVVANLAAVSIANAQLLRRTEELATTDGLTGLYNHRVFQDRLGAELERLQRHPGQLALILIDIDHFKQVNDTYGHPAGDAVLKGIAHVLAESARTIDIAARYGGEEFVLVLPDTQEKGAYAIAERLRKAIKRMVFPVDDGRQIRVTLSMGVAAFPSDARTQTELIACADMALYEAKGSGRDRVVLAADVADTVAKTA